VLHPIRNATRYDEIVLLKDVHLTFWNVVRSVCVG
jgi:hypothetical protein